ncbi:MAG: glutamate-5-semialdehyde dehydrogenase [Gracilibacteraceae bacterium]|jgi:glutamate-5-semialdehyde dehydrogenase|nr:glutamate-5-semialdehyde dehydrogenase [Gracilibacteraceae bacterium]
MDFAPELLELGARAQAAARRLAFAATAEKNRALRELAAALPRAEDEILAANALDLAQAAEKGLPPVLSDRLALTPQGIRAMARAAEEVADLPDPVGGGEFWTRPNGLKIEKTRVPLGVIAIIYEARPNVTTDAAALCLKAGNACVLRGGSEALQSNLVLARLIGAAVESAGLPAGCVQLLPWSERVYAEQLMRLDRYIDVLIPRGGAALIQNVARNATVPVIETGTGVCHAFVDAAADMDKAIRVVVNAKTNKPAVCNALETVLVHRAAAAVFLPRLAAEFQAAGVEMRGCAETRALIPAAAEATEEDWSAEYGGLIISIRVVADLDEALDHIYRYGTKHSETILTEDYSAAQRFLRETDAAAVYVNASTRFTDGGRFGFGAEIGISTQKLHARGPMGLAELTTVKYVVYGDGHIVT